MDVIGTQQPGKPLLPGQDAEHGPVPQNSRLANVTADWLVLLLAAAAILVYINSLLNGFALDDGAIIERNALVHDLSALRAIWSTPYWPEFGPQLGVYRPFTITLFAVQWAAGGGEPWLFHATNILLHAGVTLLVFALLLRLVSRIPAAVGALVFAVHPLHTEAVANVVGQAEIVTAVTLVGACLLYVSRPAGVAVGWSHRLALLALYLLGLFTKESAIILPGLLVLLDFAQRRVELSWRGLARYADAMAMPLFLLAAGFAFYSIIRLGVLDGAFVGEDTGPQLAFLKQHRLLNAFRAFPEFMRLLFYPAQLSADYSPAVILPVESMTPMAGLGLVLLIGLIALALITPWAPAIGFPAGWFLIGISVVSNLFFPVGILVAERTLYLPSLAVAAVAAFAWGAISRRASDNRRTVLQFALAAVIIALGARTWVRNPDWASTSAIFTSIVRDRPESYRAQWALAAQRQTAGDRFMANMHFEAAYRIYPYNSVLLTEYANFLLIQKRYARAIALLEAANRMHPHIMRTASMLGHAYLSAGRFADALPVINRIDQLGASRASTMPMRAYAYERLGLPDRAAGAWRVVVAQPGLSTWRNWSFLARALALGGHLPEASEAIARATALASDTAAAAQVRLVAAALRAGCYQPSSAPPSTEFETAARSPLRPCDPLGDWLHDAAPQTARPLQNARTAAPRSSWPELEKTALSH